MTDDTAAREKFWQCEGMAEMSLSTPLLRRLDAALDAYRDALPKLEPLPENIPDGLFTEPEGFTEAHRQFVWNRLRSRYGSASAGSSQSSDAIRDAGYKDPGTIAAVERIIEELAESHERSAQRIRARLSAPSPSGDDARAADGTTAAEEAELRRRVDSPEHREQMRRVIEEDFAPGGAFERSQNGAATGVSHHAAVLDYLASDKKAAADRAIVEAAMEWRHGHVPIERLHTAIDARLALDKPTKGGGNDTGYISEPDTTKPPLQNAAEAAASEDRIAGGALQKAERPSLSPEQAAVIDWAKSMRHYLARTGHAKGVKAIDALRAAEAKPAPRTVELPADWTLAHGGSLLVVQNSTALDEYVRAGWRIVEHRPARTVTLPEGEGK